MPLAGSAPRALAVAELNRFFAAAVEEHVTYVLGKLGPGRLDVEGIMTRERLDELEVVLVAAVPAAHRAACERKMRVQNDPLGVEELLHAKAVAGRAGAGGVVEREQLRFERRDAVAAHRAGMTAR